MKTLFKIVLLISILFNLNITAKNTIQGSAASDRFGAALSGIGDFNGDGFDDFAICAPTASGNLGVVKIYFGFAAFPDPGSNPTPDIVITGEGGMGSSVAGNFDINGDGFKDIAISSIEHNSETGRVYIYFGTCELQPTLQFSDADIILNGQNTGNRFGSVISRGGDINGDCIDDIIISAPLFGGTAGRAYIYFGNKLTPTATSLILNNPVVCAGVADPNALFGSSISALDDLDNDGFTDFIIGAPGLGTGGHAYLYKGAAIVGAVPALTYTGEIPVNDFGASVAGIGDFNGNGIKDFIVGDPIAKDVNGIVTGRVYIYDGGLVPVCGVFLIPSFAITGNVNRDAFGLTAVCLGDHDADGFNDIMIGASGTDVSGAVYIFNSAIYKFPAPPPACIAWPSFTAPAIATDQGGNPHDRMYLVAWAGDINDDGTPDAMYSAYGTDLPLMPDAGEAYVKLAVPGILSHGKLYLKALVTCRTSGCTQIPIRVKVSLYDCVCNFIDSKNITLNANGDAIDANLNAFIKFDNLPPVCASRSYYVVIEPLCNSVVTTWSATCNFLPRGGLLNYDFTIAACQAFGCNQALIPGCASKFGLYSGDSNNDCVVDLSDVVMVFNDAVNFVSGGCCLRTDISGDSFVDITDLICTFNNAGNFVSTISPCSCPCP